MMQFRQPSSISKVFTGLIAGLAATTVAANSHLWRIHEIYSNDDGSIQFIEMQEINGADGEFNLVGRWFQTNAFQYAFPNDLPGPTAYKKFLMATAGFAALPGAPTPDYVIPDNFIDPAGDTLNFFVYDSFSLAPGLLPTDGTLSLDRYDQVALENSPTNFAGATDSIRFPVPPCTLSVTPTYADGAGLNLNFELGNTIDPAQWNVWLVVQNSTFRIRSVPIGPITPPVPLDLSLPALPPLGSIGTLTTLTTAEGILCSDWQTVNTGP
jgi:hypothetical protein